MKTKIVNHPSILQAGPIRVQEGLYPNRVVLRKVSYQYTVHRENLNAKEVEPGTIEWTHADFYWGSFFATLDEAVEQYDKMEK